jgi:hypothetical protein
MRSHPRALAKPGPDPAVTGAFVIVIRPWTPLPFPFAVVSRIRCPNQFFYLYQAVKVEFMVRSAISPDLLTLPEKRQRE